MQHEAQINNATTQLRADLRNPYETNPHATPLPVWSSSDRVFQFQSILYDMILIGFLRRKGKARVTYLLIWFSVIGSVAAAYYYFGR